jgi:uncharacterized protein (TIGR02001 family)
MKKLIISSLALGALTAVSAGWADEKGEVHRFTGNLSLTSNYVFRGISQTFDDPAIQGGFDYAHASGFYLGTWASNVSSASYNNASMELDFYGGYNGKINDDFSYNVGLVQYYYPDGKSTSGEEYDTLEAYAGVTYKFFNVKYSYTLTDYFGVNANNVPTGATANGDSDGSWYLEANATFNLPQSVSLGLHVGHQEVENYGILDYTDYKVSLAKEFAGFNFGLAYTDTDAKSGPYTVTKGGDTENIADGTFILSVGKTF